MEKTNDNLNGIENDLLRICVYCDFSPDAHGKRYFFIRREDESAVIDIINALQNAKNEFLNISTCEYGLNQKYKYIIVG